MIFIIDHGYYIHSSDFPRLQRAERDVYKQKGTFGLIFVTYRCRDKDEGQRACIVYYTFVRLMGAFPDEARNSTGRPSIVKRCVPGMMGICIPYAFFSLI